MTSLLGRLLRLFPESVPLEDLFTEAVAHLFETRPQLCLAWLKEAGLLAPTHAARVDEGYVRVVSQKPFASLEHHSASSRPDLLLEAYRSPDEILAEDETVADVIMIESKIGSGEGQEQLRRYAEHLDKLTGVDGKASLYITRDYDPKDLGEILTGLDDNTRFKQLCWHDFYRFLQRVEKDALVEEVMTFMEEQGMARNYRFSATDLIALSGVPRAFEIFDETLDGEVRSELEEFAGNKVRRETQGLNYVRSHGRYIIVAPLHRERNLFCFVAYERRAPDGYPAAIVALEARPGAMERDASVAAMKRMVLRKGWTDLKIWTILRNGLELGAGLV